MKKEKQQELVKELMEIQHKMAVISNSTWDEEKDRSTPEWHITIHIYNTIQQAIRHLNDIIPPWEE